MQQGQKKRADASMSRIGPLPTCSSRQRERMPPRAASGRPPLAQAGKESGCLHEPHRAALRLVHLTPNRPSEHRPPCQDIDLVARREGSKASKQSGCLHKPHRAALHLHQRAVNQPHQDYILEPCGAHFEVTTSSTRGKLARMQPNYMKHASKCCGL